MVRGIYKFLKRSGYWFLNIRVYDTGEIHHFWCFHCRLRLICLFFKRLQTKLKRKALLCLPESGWLLKIQFPLTYSISHWLFLSLALNWAPAVHCSLEQRHLKIERSYCCRALELHFNRIVSGIRGPKFQMISTFLLI